MQFAEEKLIPATLIAGDGIGPEIVEATITVLDALNAPFAWETHKAGMSGWRRLATRFLKPLWTVSNAPAYAQRATDDARRWWGIGNGPCG
jgi:isocitrate/isopropylmalate dehydrogenase